MPPSSSNNYRKAAQPTVADTAGRIAPRDTRLEAAVLGALMLEKDAYTIVCDILHADSFYEPAHQRIYEAIQTLGAAQSPIDMLTVVEQLRLNGTLDSVGGTAYVAQLTMEVASAANVEFHARIVAQKYLSRQLIGFASELETKAFDESIDVDDVLQEAEGKLFEISQRNVKKEVTQIDPVISQAIEAIQTAANRTSGLSGLESGYHDLDKLTSGWQNSDLIIIAARPAMGKTAFVLSMAKNMAVNYNTPVAIFSLEMSNVQLVNRLISNVCEIEGSKIKSGQLTPIEWNQLMGRIKNLTGAPLYIDDTPSLSIFELRTKARRLVREHGVRMIIIDYLQLMNASGMKFGSREQEVSMISRSLKQLAKELNLPIEQDADMVCFIHRPEYYLHSDTDASGRDIRGLAEFIVAKHRSGAVDDVKMRFRAPVARFENWNEAAVAIAQGTHASRLNDALGADAPAPVPGAAPMTGGSADLSAPPSDSGPLPF